MSWKPKKFFSPEQVEAAMTPKGGFSRKSLAKLGVPWPPPKGWRKALTERLVTSKEIVRRGRKHAARYVNEVTFRLNAGNVANHTLDRLDSFIRAVDGQRLTYERLIA